MIKGQSKHSGAIQTVLVCFGRARKIKMVALQKKGRQNVPQCLKNRPL